MRLLKHILLVALIPLAFGCTDAWDDHTKVNADVSNQNLLQYIEANPNTSAFAALVKSAGLESELTDLEIKTMYVPNSASLASLSTEITSNQTLLKQFVLNHIVLGKYNKLHTTGVHRLKMLSGKVLVLNADENNLDNVAIDVPSEKKVLNGIVQVVAAPITPRLSVWEYIEQLAPVNKHTNYLKSLSSNRFSAELSTQTGVNAQGKPVYDSVFVWYNEFCDKVADLTNEDSTYTFLIVEDAVYNQEYEKFKRFYRVVNGTTARDSALVKARIVKDYVFTTAYAPGQVPAVLKSMYEVGVPFSEGAVVSQFKASNGYVYVLSSCDIPLQEKIRPIIVQTEAPDSYYGLSSEKGAPNRYLRKRDLAQGGYDVVLDNWNTGTALSDGLIMHAGEIASTTYKFYWRAINDFVTSYRNPLASLVLNQKLGFCVPKSYGANGRVNAFAPPTFVMDAFLPVTATEYQGTGNAPLDEVNVGSYTFVTVNEIYLQLVPSAGRMAVTADYVKMVPVFN